MEYFKFEDEFADVLDMFDANDTGQSNVLRPVITFSPPVTAGGHVVEIEINGETKKVVRTTGGVLLGKMSFKMLTDEFDISGFELVTNSITPTTGVKVDVDVSTNYTDPSIFRFKDATASKDATLSNLIVSSGEINEEDETKSTYKEYTLSPPFDKATKKYELVLLEYIDTIDIKATQSDLKAKMKIKVPKRDSGGNLVYDSDGTTIIYEEKDLIDKTALNVILNKLGEQDTVITVLVTAEDRQNFRNVRTGSKTTVWNHKGKCIFTTNEYIRNTYSRY